jgi:hypothetical protein
MNDSAKFEFVFTIVGSIGFHWIGSLVFGRHRKPDFCHANVSQTRGWIRTQPLEVALRLVFLVSIAKPILLTQPISEFSKPRVIGETLASPDRTRMVKVCPLVSILGKNQSFLIPVCRIQQLGSFKDHLYDMLVAMIFRGFLWVEREEKDIHSGVGLHA